MSHFGAKLNDNVHSVYDVYGIDYFALKNCIDCLDHLAVNNCDYLYV